IERMYPEGLGTPGAAPAGSEADDAPADHADRSGARPVASAVDGYLQAIDQAGLMEAATAADVQFVMACRPGDFLVRGEPLLWVRPADRCRPELADAVRPLFMFGTSRTTEQDVEFAIDQMAEIAVRALSPGTNDPFTAVTCVDWLGSALARIAAGDLHSPWRHDAGGKLRIVARVTTFPAYCDAAFDQVRHYAKGSLNVHVRLLEAIAKALPHTKTDAQRAALLHHAELIVRQGRDSFPEAHDRCQIEAAYARATAPIMPADAPTG
ncbi:MAG TPA: DUF2254 family protein, partial [Tepidisphaeraceae bacterium]|nr:DUF2254 family protein [Tepidisphaeraceae bacterium]